MRRSPVRCTAASGFTLVELLVALAIAALVTAVLFAAYHVVFRTSEHQGARDRVATEGVHAVDQVTRDLLGAFHVPKAPTLQFTLGGADEQRLLAFCTTVPPSTDPDLRWFSTKHVAYLLRGATLFRVSRGLTEGDTVSETNVVARGLRAFEAEAWTGTSWAGTWPPSERSEPLPRAIRVRVTMEETAELPPRTFETEVYVPAGNTVTSNLTRVGGQVADPGTR